MNINYNKLLDDWAEHILKKAHTAENKRLYEDLFSYKGGYLKGYSEGIRTALAHLSLLEKRKYKNYLK